MSELIQKHDNRATIRWKLLTSASALALVATVASSGTACAGDAERPLVWLELGGQFSRLQDQQEIYSPPFLALEPTQFSSPRGVMQAPRYGLDASGTISFQPEDSNWVFAASIRYGRASRNNHLHEQTYPAPTQKYLRFPGALNYFTRAPLAAQFIDTNSTNTESHAILDFQAGRDLGLGLFGHESSSSLNLGVRVAQFTSKSSATLRENPDWQFQVHTYSYYSGLYVIQAVHQPYHSYAGHFEAERSFHGIGPSLSWKSSTLFAGNAQDGLTLDWGVNASLLFGRQKAHTQHNETAQYHSDGAGFSSAPPGVRTTLYHHPTNAPFYHSTRSRNVTVPNVGGFAGLSFIYSNAKVSFGYKADFFFNAIDGGIGARKEENRSFYGPYASISIGLGD